MLSNDFYGGGRFRTLGSNVVLTLNDERVQCFNPTSAGKTVTLPDARYLKVGGPIFYIVNVNLTNDISLRYNNGVVLGTAFAGESCVLSLVNNSTRNGVWVKHG